MVELRYGWMKYDPSLPDEIAGHYVPRVETKTRVEEYHFVRNELLMEPPHRVLDAAAGYVSAWHKLPIILADTFPKVLIDAYDMNPQSLDMPEHARVSRTLGRIEHLQLNDNTYDTILCISTLEHCPDHVARAFVEEAARVAKPGAIIILTADNYPGVSPEGLNALLSTHFDTGRSDGRDTGTQFPGGKQVAYATGRYNK